MCLEEKSHVGVGGVAAIVNLLMGAQCASGFTITCTCVGWAAATDK
jgi:hypothetical protein